MLKITRSQVEGMFGTPPYVSANKRAMLYVMGTEHGIVVWPLCFGAGFDVGDTHLVKLVFDDQDRLLRVTSFSQKTVPPTYMFGQYQYGVKDSDHRPLHYFIMDTNENCPAEERIVTPDGVLIPHFPLPAGTRRSSN